METLLSIQNVKKHYIVKKNILSPKQRIQAVDDVSFEIFKGETLGLIGESGCGKTTLSNMIMQLIHQDEGQILFKGKTVSQLVGLDMKTMRKNLQVVFQHSFGALDPIKTTAKLLMEPLTIHGIVAESEVQSEVRLLLERVGLSEQVLGKYPGQLSGGQKQRVGIARAIATRPELLICDEPVSALDVSVQGQILNLLQDLKSEMDLTYLFVSHDLKVIRHIADRIAVMYGGRIIEIGSVDDILNHPKEAYTKKLIATL